MSISYFDKVGKEINVNIETPLLEINSLAKSYGGNACYVKVGTGMAHGGFFLNPYSVVYNDGDEAKFDSTKGKYYYEFVKVRPSVFNNYVQFLQTRNEVWLRHAERENADYQR